MSDRHHAYDSDLHAFHAYELALEAQRLTFCMAAISALSSMHVPVGTPQNVRVLMYPMSYAIFNEAAMSAGPETRQEF
jgi:hypothetical protein